MLVLVGSCASASHWCADVPPRDIDVVGEYDDVRFFVKEMMGDSLKSFMPTAAGKGIVAKSTDGLIIEGEIAWPGSSAQELMELVKADPNTTVHQPFAQFASDYRGEIAVPSINVLFMLKMSHRFLKNSPHYAKTRADCQLLAARGAHIQPEHFDFYKRREAATYAYKHPSLNVAKKDFFAGDGIQYKYDHDSIHEAVKHMDKPAYTYFKPVNSEVMCSREMFELLPNLHRLYAVLEESYVLAAERSQLAFPGSTIDPRKSFLIALEKVCTSITSGWFREFAWNNYYDVLALYDHSYMDRVHSGIDDGTVKLTDPSSSY